MNKERREALLEVVDILDEAINQIEEIKFEEYYCPLNHKVLSPTS